MNIVKLLNKHVFVSYWLPVIGAGLVIAFFSLMPQPFSAIGIDKGDLLNFDMLHILAYFVLSFLLGVAIRRLKKEGFRGHSYILPILMIVIFSGFIELVQAIVPGRWMSFMDLVYNIGGAVAAQIFRFVLKKERF